MLIKVSDIEYVTFMVRAIVLFSLEVLYFVDMIFIVKTFNN